MKPPAYVLLPQANDDLVESAQYLIESASEAVAARFVRSVFTTSALIGGFPGMGMHCHFRRSGLRRVRRFPASGFERWLIFYRPVPGGIEVVRLLHSSRDWARLFS